MLATIIQRGIFGILVQSLSRSYVFAVCFQFFGVFDPVILCNAVLVLLDLLLTSPAKTRWLVWPARYLEASDRALMW